MSHFGLENYLEHHEKNLFNGNLDLKINRTLLSVSDKTGLAAIARELKRFGSELIATGGTAKLLEQEQLSYRPIEEFTGNPEAFDGRMKTLSFRLEGAILYDRENPAHVEQAERLDVPAIDCVICNLYPFEETLEKLIKEDPGLRIAGNFKALIEKIDVGGPTMIRAAAKNFRNVLVLVDPEDYGSVIEDLHLRAGTISLGLREELMLKAFERLAAYEHAIAQSLNVLVRTRRSSVPVPLIQEKSHLLSHGFLPHGKMLPLRYGENPHQKSFFVSSVLPEAVDWFALSERGIALSYNNVLDGQSAFETAHEALLVAREMDFGRSAGLEVSPHVVCIVKHNNPCGLAVAPSLREALEAAWSGDPVSSFGGVLALSHQVDLDFVQALEGRFVEMILAPSFSEQALEKISTSKKKVRCVITHGWTEPVVPLASLTQVTRVHGGYLVQEKDSLIDSEFQTVSQTPWSADFGLARFGVVATKAVKSNAIVIVREKNGIWQMIGMGSGQPNRVDALRRLALPKAHEVLAALGEDSAQVLAHSVLISDAFFPFADIIEVARAAGIKFILQPGGSIRDAEVIAACDDAGISMVFTGQRHFRH